jgi:hypothetical protein
MDLLQEITVALDSAAVKTHCSSESIKLKEIMFKVTKYRPV